MFRELLLRCWLRGLGSSDARRRRRACEALGRLGDARAVEPLIERLSDGIAGVREAAGEALRTLGENSGRARPGLERLVNFLPRLHDDDWRVREQACNTLGQSPDARGVVGLAGGMSDSDRRVARAATAALLAVAAESPAAFLARVRHFSPRARADISAALSARTGPLDTTAPVGVLTHGADAEVRRRACETLGKLGGPCAMGPLVRRLWDANSRVRQAACRALGSLGDARAAPSVVKALEDHSARVRGAACAALADIGDRGVIGSVTELAQAADAEVRAAACTVLGTLGDGESVPVLLERLGDLHARVRGAAGEALGRLGEASLADAVLGSVHGDEESREEVRRLAENGEARALQPLLSLLRDPSDKIRANVCAALGETGDDTALRPLLRILSDSEPSVRAAACRAAARVGGKRVVKHVADCLDDESAVVQAAACEALGAIGDRRVADRVIALAGASDAQLRESACRALVALGESRLGNALASVWEERASGLEELARLASEGDLRALSVLLPRLADTKSRVRRLACQGLGAVGDDRASGALIERLGDFNAGVRQAACDALTDLGEGRVAHAVIGALDGEVPSRQELRRLATTGDVRALAPLVGRLDVARPSATNPALHALVAIGVRATDQLLARLQSDEVRHPYSVGEALRLIHESTVGDMSKLACGEHFVRFETRTGSSSAPFAAQYLACRACGRAESAIHGVAAIVARLDDDMSEAHELTNHVAHVNWLRRRGLPDFERVDIVKADDRDVEEFCVQVGNDTDEVRTRRYRTVECSVDPKCELSPSTVNMLRANFGTVSVHAIGGPDEPC